MDDFSKWQGFSSDMPVIEIEGVLKRITWFPADEKSWEDFKTLLRQARTKILSEADSQRLQQVKELAAKNTDELKSAVKNLQELEKERSAPLSPSPDREKGFSDAHRALEASLQQEAKLESQLAALHKQNTEKAAARAQAIRSAQAVKHLQDQLSRMQQ